MGVIVAEGCDSKRQVVCRGDECEQTKVKTKRNRRKKRKKRQKEKRKEISAGDEDWGRSGSVKKKEEEK